MSLIVTLDDHLISQIAAGEVIERPSSVVKELIENALDAGATDIQVDLEDGGKARIRVSDNGQGIAADQLELAFQRHATSKIREFDDLQAIGTLGFRGEALATIAAVATVEARSSVNGTEAMRLVIDGGSLRSKEPTSRQLGTTVDVERLFFNVPARRKFLKRTSTELQRCLEIVQGYALARPEVAFVVRHGDRELLRLVAWSDDEDGLRSRIGELFGPVLEEHLLQIGPRELGDGGRVHGFIDGPSRSHARKTFVFVNRRLVRDRALLAVFYQAVRREWHSDRFPSIFLFLDMPTQSIDVNVHPQKSEVRFRDPGTVGGVASSLVRTLRSAIPATPGFSEDLLQSGEHAPPPSWRGLGGPRIGTHGVPSTSGEGGLGVGREIREGYSGASASADGLAQVSYAPDQRKPVPLTGRNEGPASLRLLGQYKGTLLLFEGPDGLFLVDQHVAHERVLYERFRIAMKGRQPASQRLLSPQILDFVPAEIDALIHQAEALKRCGLEIQELSGDTLGLLSVPAMLDEKSAEKLLRAFLAGGGAEAGPDEAAQHLLEAMAASLSCKAAVKMHHPLHPNEAENLMLELFEAEHPWTCPHGRPVILKLSDRDLEKRFKRR